MPLAFVRDRWPLWGVAPGYITNRPGRLSDVYRIPAEDAVVWSALLAPQGRS